jgi:LysR family hydrogen peroxide-inducible transcriptional activator
MNLQFIKYFVVLSETGNFTKAAQKVHVVQSSFSTGIKKLEQQLSCKLFFRDNRQVHLTEEGKQLLPKAKQLLRVWNDMESLFSVEYAKPLRLGVVSEIDFKAIVPMMKSFHERFPSHQVQIVEGNEAELHQNLKNESIDGFFQKYIPDEQNGFEHQLIRKDKLVLAVPVQHVFASKSKLPLKSIDQQDLVERTNCSLYMEVESCLDQHEIKPNIVFQAKGDDMARALVASGIGISLIPQIDTEYPNIKYVSISDHQFHRKIFLVWKKGNTSKMLKNLLSL